MWKPGYKTEHVTNTPKDEDTERSRKREKGSMVGEWECGEWGRFGEPGADREGL